MRRIVLVGFMGAGKSTVGPLLARELGWRFVDIDPRIEASTGLSVAALFAQRGEAFFRQEERRVAEELAAEDHVVVATGGGAFADQGTREILKQDAVVVWLQCDFETAVGRLPPDGSRPLAANRERMRSLFAERESSYRLADVVVDAQAGGPEEVARRIARAVGRRGAGGAEDVDR
ncbi:MAG: shikimate kinase [Vicinamibacteria bacterium]